MNQDIIEKQQVRGSSASIAKYAGKEGQIVFNRDNKRLHVMSGTAGQSTQYLSTAQAATKTQLGTKLDASTYNSEKANFATKSQIPDTSTLATKSEVTSGLANKVDTSTYTADKATFALKTEIPDTSGYATTTALTQGLAGKLDTTGKAASATVADSANAVAWANVSGKPTIPDGNDYILKAGNRNVLSGYEKCSRSSGTSVSIGYSTGDYIQHDAQNNSSVTVNVDGGNIADIGDACGVKVLRLYNTGSTSTLTFNKANGITTLDYFGSQAPTLDGKANIHVVIDFYGVNASLRVTPY